MRQRGKPTFVDGIGPPLEQLREDYQEAWDERERRKDLPLGRGQAQAAWDVLRLIDEVYALHECVADLERKLGRPVRAPGITVEDDPRYEPNTALGRDAGWY